MTCSVVLRLVAKYVDFGVELGEACLALYYVMYPLTKY